jgi:hypothetical protein
MSTAPPPPPSQDPSQQPSGYGAPPAYGGYGGAPYVGQQRNIGWQILIGIVTLGIYGYYWAYRSFEDLKLHTGQGVGGVVGLVIQLFVGIVNVFLLPIEIQQMYEREGMESPVTWVSGFWVFLFVIPWYVKMQQALNDHWAGHGAAPAEGFVI